jgi:hypothetical protein
MSSIAIQSINLVNNQITVLFDQRWFQEDIITLRQLLLSHVSNISIKEIVIGADIENVRFEWLDTEFTINFDYYSQSCWFDTQDLQSLAETQALFTLLTQNNERYV